MKNNWTITFTKSFESILKKYLTGTALQAKNVIISTYIFRERLKVIYFLPRSIFYMWIFRQIFLLQ